MASVSTTDKASSTKGHGRGHSRVVSASRTPLARRSTRGPLDVDDPLATEAESSPLNRATSRTEAAEAVNTPIPTTPFSPELSSVRPTSTPPPPSTATSKDFGYLLRAEIYHPLSQLDIPPAFRKPKHQSYSSQSLSHLLSSHHFRSAATVAALRICSPPAPSPAELFSLVYTRLACLTLINHLPFAAEESKALQDVNSPFYADETTGKNLLPWELRVLVVRLQGIGYGDGRRRVSGYYDLAKEARAEIKDSKGSEEKQEWKIRLEDLGICVANALIELGDLGAAARHLECLRTNTDKTNGSLDGRLALLYINLGDIDAARRCLFSAHSSSAALTPLLSMAESRYLDAIEEWKGMPSNDIATQNLAVCLFYAGRVEETLELLDGLIEKGRSFHALTFNLATVYELCAERARERKDELVERVARAIEKDGGGERGAVDFKL